MRHNWRNWINERTLKPLKSQKWSLIIQKRIAQFVRLYTHVTSFSTLLMVSHDNMISMYDMSKECWTDTMKVGEDPIRLLAVKGRPFEQI